MRSTDVRKQIEGGIAAFISQSEMESITAPEGMCWCRCSTVRGREHDHSVTPASWVHPPNLYDLGVVLLECGHKSLTRPYLRASSFQPLLLDAKFLIRSNRPVTTCPPSSSPHTSPTPLTPYYPSPHPSTNPPTYTA